MAWCTFYVGCYPTGVIGGFMAQGVRCDPPASRGWGMWEGRTDKPDLAAVFNSPNPHGRRCCVRWPARRTPKHAPNSQFFICLDDARFLDKQYHPSGPRSRAAWNTSTRCPMGEPPRSPGKIVKATGGLI